jgi:glucuronokinase
VLAVSVRDFSARVSLEEAPEIEIPDSPLVAAAVRRFVAHCRDEGRELAGGFRLRYESDIPREVGLGGSSAIVTAVLRALCERYSVHVSRERLPTLALSVETEELGMVAGLQDRVVQVYEGLVHMDFAAPYMATHGYGRYETLDPGLLPRLYLAFHEAAAAPSASYHRELRARYERGDRTVMAALRDLAELPPLARDRLCRGDHEGFSRLLDAGFELRRRIAPLDARHVRMVELARSHGVSATFAGSGGTVVGVCEDADAFERLRSGFAAEGCRVIRPAVA